MFSGFLFLSLSQIISLVSVHPVIDPRHEAQMGPSRAKQQRQHPPLLESVWGHTLLLVKCVLFAALCVLPVNPSDASLLRQFGWLTVTSFFPISLGLRHENREALPSCPLRTICHRSLPTSLPSLSNCLESVNSPNG